MDEVLDTIKDKSNVKTNLSIIHLIEFLTYSYTVTRLKGMHRKHLLPGFEDKSSDEAAIEALTMEITNVHFIKHMNTCKTNTKNRNFIV